jgi:hypothetical protein
MKNKRVLGLALILLALVAGVVFAAKGEVNGVYWVCINGQSTRLGKDQGATKYYLEVYNSNDYRVELQIANSGWGGRNHYLNAGETKHFPASAAGNTYVQVVTKK